MVCIKVVMHIMNDRVTRGARGRREHSPELKRELVERSLLPGASVSAIALEAGINANLLFTWRRAHRSSAEQTPGPSTPVLLPVSIEALSRSTNSASRILKCC
jgi:transposase